jgi:DNA-directed RNA polymerase specialized sigma24 family protein
MELKSGFRIDPMHRVSRCSTAPEEAGVTTIDDDKLKHSILKSVDTIANVVRCFMLSEDERDEVAREAVVEFERRLVLLGQTAAMHSLLPVIRRRAKLFFARNGVDDADTADNLSSELSLRIWRCVTRHGISGNAGALVAKARERVLLSHKRSITRAKSHTATNNDLALIADRDTELERDTLDDLLTDFPRDVRPMVRLRLQGRSWKDIGILFDMTPTEVKNAIQRAWPTESSPPSKRRKRR